MKKTKIVTLTLLMAGLVAAGCTKPESEEPANGRKGIKMFANAFVGNGSKVSFNAGNPGTPANWIENEPVTLNDGVYTVNEQADDQFYMMDGSEFVAPLDEDMVSVYPGESFNDNVLEVSGNTVILHSLKIGFLEGGRQSMAFPMVATATADATELYYNHLTGGLQLTLKNNGTSDVNVAKLTIVAQSNEDVVNLGTSDYTARWELETDGPWMPMGAVGQNGDEVNVKFSSVMNFTLEDENENAYKSIGANGSTVQFCVPITISKMKYLKVYGYDESGNVIFYAHKDFAGTVTVMRNQMYALPDIEFGAASGE